MTSLLLTGGAGFIGSNFIRYLLANTDWRITVLDRLDEAGTWNRVMDLRDAHPTRLISHWHDLRAPVNPSFMPGPFDYVAHLAAGSHVDRSVRDPLGFVMDNVVGTANLLEYCRAVRPQKLLYFSTDEVFGPAPDGVVFDEHSPHTPNNPYAASKAGGEALCPAWANTYGLPITVTHCTNVYGPGQYSEKFIPLATRKILSGETLDIHAKDGVPSSRYYIHVDDVSRAILTVLQHGETIRGPWTGKYNITGDREYSNLEVARSIADTLNRPLHTQLIEDPPGRPRPDQRYAIGGVKLKALGWAPQVPFAQGLRETVQGLITHPPGRAQPAQHHPV